jgi:hypothetical protein
MDAPARGDDHDLGEFVGVQTEGFLRVASFDRDRKPVRLKPIFTFEDGVRHGGR